jgi:hypothetical protein
LRTFIGIIPPLKTMSSVLNKIIPLADTFSEAAPTSSFAMSNTISVMIAVKPNQAIIDVAVEQMIYLL